MSGSKFPRQNEGNPWSGNQTKKPSSDSKTTTSSFSTRTSTTTSSSSNSSSNFWHSKPGFPGSTHSRTSTSRVGGGADRSSNRRYEEQAAALFRDWDRVGPAALPGAAGGLRRTEKSPMAGSTSGSSPTERADSKERPRLNRTTFYTPKNLKEKSTVYFREK